VAEKVTGSAIDDRTTRHPGCSISQRKRKLIEQVFGWLKTVGGLRKLRHRGGARVDWVVTFAAAAYNLIRLRTLLPDQHDRHATSFGRHRDLHRRVQLEIDPVASHFFIGLLDPPVLDFSDTGAIVWQCPRYSTSHSRHILSHSLLCRYG
jgi:hypothetical protein